MCNFKIYKYKYKYIMSNAPYNKYSVRDLSGNKQPYVNSIAEFGYFSGTSVGTIPPGYWYSLPAVLNTNNGLASVDASGGLTMLNSGIYKINLSLFPTVIGDASSSISFCFGSKYLFDFSTNLVVDAFGGAQSTGMFTFNPSYNNSIPGIINWIANGYSSGNSTTSNFVKNSITNELGYNYNTGGNSSQIDSGICTTEITFVLDSSATIFFNVSTNSSTGATFDNCYFTLQLMYNYYPSPSTFVWTQTDASNNNWTSIASDSTGQYLAAVYNSGNSSGGIYTSNNYGSSWSITSAPNAGWMCIASDSTGRYLAAGSYGYIDGYGPIYGKGIITSSDYGINWNPTISPHIVTWISIVASSDWKYLAAGTSYFGTDGEGIWTSSDPTHNIWRNQTLGSKGNWTSIASDSTGKYLAAVTNNGDGIFTSENYGESGSWTQRINGLPKSASWSSIASSSDGIYLAAVIYNGGIYTSDDSGNSWTQRTNGLPSTANWYSITSDSKGRYLAAVAHNGGIYTSNNYGVNWSLQTSAPTNAGWQSITSSSDGTKLAAVVYGGGIYTGTLS